jgi:tetratricopeptide (TPR) repeat protein
MTPAAARALLLGLAFWPALVSTGPDREAELRRAVQLHSRALADMEEGNCDRALEHLRALARILPDNVLPPTNEAICHYRLGRSEEAQAALERAASIAPDNPRVLYTRARILSESGAPRGQLDALLQRFAAAHPGDPRPHYLAALAAGGEPRHRVEHLRAALARDPENLVLLADLLVAGAAAADVDVVADALNGIEDRLDGFEGPLAEEAERLRRLLSAQEREELAPSATVVRNILRPHGLYQVHRLPLVGRPDRGLFPQLDFDPPLPKLVQGGQDLGISFSESAVLEALAPVAVFGRTQEGDVLYARDGDRLVRLAWDGRALRRSGERGPVIGDRTTLHDVTGDGLTDLVTIYGDGRVVLHPGSDGGGWGEPLVVGNADASPVSFLVPADLDHDGDLDLLVGRQAAPVLLFENGGSRWVERAAARGLSDPSASAAAAVADFDGDGVLDVLLARRDGPPRLLISRRAESFTDAGGRVAALPRAGGAVAFDADGDGRFDLLLWGAGEPGLWRNLEAGFVAVPLPEAVGGPWLAAAAGDFDNDGDVDVAVLLGEKGELWLLRNRRERWSAEPLGISAPGARQLLAGDLDGDGDLDLVVDTGTSTRLWRNEGGNRNHWIRLVLRGRIEASGKNNSEGLHARIEARVGDHFQAHLGTGGVNHLGLGAARQADVVRVVWPNGIAQTWQMVAADRTLVEEQVLKGSCPFLYTWDGERFRFVTDLMWPSPLGMILADGSPAPHDSARDWVAIPDTALRPAGESLWIQVTEELWETAYVDELRLVAVDAPPGVTPLLDEALRPPPYPREPSLFPARELRPAAAARTERGQDVTRALERRDGERVDALPLSRYQGLTEGHHVELSFTDVPAGRPLRLVLWGWTFPTDTTINYALAQDPSRELRPPRLELRTADGSWREIVPFLGFPKGKEKAVVTDVTGVLPAGTATVRVSTNQQIYWDAAALAVGGPAPRARLQALAPEDARLHYRGFSAPLPRPDSAPHLFDYEAVSVAPRFRDMQGRFTRYGPVTPLLQAADDRYVVMNAGDEMTVRFSTRALPPLPAGWSRSWLLYTDGWVKDGDIHTARSASVEPLPYHGMLAYPDVPAHRYPAARNREYLERHQTRQVDARPFREVLMPRLEPDR